MECPLPSSFPVPSWLYPKEFSLLESFLGEGGVVVRVVVVEDSELGREELLEGWVVEGGGEEEVVPGDKP